MLGNKRIALITTWFPPQQSVATNRMLAFVEYLSTHYEIEVFCLAEKKETVKWKDQAQIHYSTSSLLFERLKDKQKDAPILHKIKVATRILLSKMSKNPLMKWKNKSIEKLIELHKENPFDLIISSFSPHEAHQVAIEFCRKFPKIPWVADMRDEMSPNPYIDKSTKANLAAIEKEVDQFASAIISVSKPIVDDFKKMCPKVQYFEEIRNGFNHTFRRDLLSQNKNEIFTFGYFGTFYGTQKPTIVLEALKQLCQEIEEFDFKWEIIGAHQNFSVPDEICNKVVLLPQLNYLEAIQKMATMDLNVLLHPRSKRKGVFTGKLFDYISVQKPVLALVDKDDVAADLILDFNCGYVAEFSDCIETKAMILKAYSDWKENHIHFATLEQVESLHRKHQVDKLKKLINKLITE